MKISSKIGFIGAGNMAEAMIGALVRQDAVSRENLLAGDRDAARLSALNKAFGLDTRMDNGDVFSEAEVVVLAVKPQVLAAVLEELRNLPAEKSEGRKLLVSIAAGFSIKKMEEILYKGLSEKEQALRPIIRVMPNTPSLVGAGMAALSGNRHAGEGDMALARSILESAGRVVELPEEDLDAVTAVSGSGPAYVFFLAEAMAEAAEGLGLSKETARLLVTQTLKGSALLLEARPEETPGELRKKVTSPGGTTEAAFKVLLPSGVKERIVEALTRPGTGPGSFPDNRRKIRLKGVFAPCSWNR